MPTYEPPAPPFIRARYTGGAQRPRAIVLHGTVSSDNKGTARNIAGWWAGPASPKSSCHYIVDPAEVIQSVGDHTVAYHCGYNTGSIGVEFCDEQEGPANRWDDADSRAILKRGARLVAQLCLAYDIEPVRPSTAALKRKGPHGIYGHNDSRLAFGGTTHTDPRDFPWAKFMKMVKAEIAAIKAEAVTPEPPRGKTFKVLHAPLHGGSATQAELRKALRRRGVISVVFSEAYRHGDFLASRPGWRATMGDRHKDAKGRQVQRDVVVMVRDWRIHHEDGIRQASRAATPLRIAPERYLVWSVDNVDGAPLATIGIHPHAAVRQAWDSKRAAEYRRAMFRLKVLVRQLRAKYGADLDVVVLGDLNYPDVEDGRALAPRAVFKSLGMEWEVDGIDWVAASKGLQIVGKKVIPKGVNGQDHPWLEVELARR